MSLFEKRQFYKCGYNFVTLEEIPTWSSSSTEAFQTKKPPSNSNWLKLVNEKVSLYTGNIIALEIDAIVNSANTKLRNRKNGIDGYIHTAAGKKYLEAECQSLGGCERGKCKITDIIHCVGPIGENDAVLSSCYESALDTLKVNNLRSIAFPAISTGQYGYSAEKAVPVVLKAIRRWLEKPVNLASVDRIIVVRYLDQDTALFKQHMPKYFSHLRFNANVDYGYNR
ncbi:O-acetyl-ADP-ribose deacetylase macrod2, partial [Tyrophagus putrescentiae]